MRPIPNERRHVLRQTKGPPTDFSLIQHQASCDTTMVSQTPWSDTTTVSRAAEEDFVRITLRIPRDLHARLTEEAGRKRSMNAEIITRLEESFPDPRLMDHLRFENMLRERESLMRSLSDLQERMSVLDEHINAFRPKG